MNIMRDERQNYGNSDQENDDPLQNLHSAADHLIRNFMIDAFKGFEFTQDADVPVGEMKTLGSQSIQSGQILIAEQLQDVVHAFKQDGAVHLPLRDLAQV